MARDADSKAESIRPEAVSPLIWRAAAAWPTVLVLLLVVGTMYLPKFDPFGIYEEQAIADARRQELDEQKKLMAQRLEALRNKPLTAEMSGDVEQMLAELLNDFGQMKPHQMQANLNRLNEHQKQIGRQWRNASEENLRRSDHAHRLQQFGRLDPQIKQWKKELNEGRIDGLKNQINSARELARRLAKAGSSEESRRLGKELEQKLRSLAEFAKNQAGNTPLDRAMRRATEQLQAAGMRGMSSEAMRALEMSLELGELEAEALAQAMRDLGNLEDALELIALAKMANAAEELDGSDQLASLAEYRKLYAKFAAHGQCGSCNGTGQAAGNEGCPDCQGSGTGGKGRGRGGLPPENDEAETAFKSEKSRAALQAGKMLLEWKEGEVPEAGQSQIDYTAAIDNVRQGVSEAILQEQVPPGYRDAIQKYFDTIGSDVRQ